MPQAHTAITTGDTPPNTTAITVHHLTSDACDSDEEYVKLATTGFGDTELSITRKFFNEYYTPVETVLDVTDVEEGFTRSQGFNVNKQCNAWHAVRSSRVNDVLEMKRPNGSTTFHRIDPIGVTELDIGKNNANPTDQP